MGRSEAGGRGARGERRVLVVDDAEGIRSVLASQLELRGYRVDTAEDGRAALELLESGAAPDAVILDVMMPGLSGIETLRRLREAHPRLPVVMLSVVGKASTIVEAMQLGADDYLNKPFEAEELERTLDALLAREEPAAELLSEAEADRVFWEGEALSGIRRLLGQVADTDVTVLVQGESGVGKEVVARTLHQLSGRSHRAFLKVNCAALPGELLESELFGYEKGAFTGATGRRLGRFEQAEGGSLFLDEIGEMSPAAQAKLLHVLQDGAFTRLGGNREVRVDVRIVAATNRPLEDMVSERSFREDLFYRLNVVNVRIPPLRERREELPSLVEFLARRVAAQYGRPRPRISSRLMELFARYPFPGNVRELENMLKRIVVLETEAPIAEEILTSAERGARGPRPLELLLEEVEATAGDLPLREVGRRASLEAERETIERVLLRTGWNRKHAARVLGVSYKTLLAKIRETGLAEEGADPS